MLNSIKKLLGQVAEASTASSLPENEDQLLASAAAMLLLEVAWADHDMSTQEIELIKTSLQKLFDLSTALTQQLVDDARAKHDASVGLYEYTRTLNDDLNPEEKFDLMVALWRLANSDQILHSLEEHAIRRISELLYVPHALFIRAKQVARQTA